MAAKELDLDAVDDPPAELHRQGRVPVLHPDRERLRLRRLRAGARQGARAGRPRPLARRAGDGCASEGRYIGIGLVTCQERSVFSATEFWFWFDEPGAPVTSMPESVTLRVGATRRHHGDAVLLRVLGQQPRDDGRAARGRGVRLRAARRQRRLRRHAQRAARHRARRQPHDGDARRRGRGRRRAHQGQGDQGRRAPPRGRPGRPRMGRRRRPGQGLAGAAQDARPTSRSRRTCSSTASPRRWRAGLEASKVYDHPYTTMPSRGPQEPRRLLPVRRPRLPHPDRRGRLADGRGHVPQVHRRARLRDARQPALARRAHHRRDGPGDRDRAARGVRLRRRTATSSRRATWTT